MGRYGWKRTVESTKRIELARLNSLGLISKNARQTEGRLQWSNGYGEQTGDIQIFINTGALPCIRLKYKVREHGATGAEWRSYDYSFPLESIPCRYGGQKWFIRCQLSKNGVFCGRRVRILYSAGDYFGCRHCADLTYERCNYGGRYKGFISIPDLDEQEMKVGRRFYRGKPTRKYRRLLKMEEQFERSFITNALWLKRGDPEL